MHNWLQLHYQAQIPSMSRSRYLVNVMEPPLISYECLQSRATQLSMDVLGNFLGEIMWESTRNIRSPSLLSVHLGSLRDFHAKLPIDLCLRPSNKTESSSWLFGGTNCRHKASILSIHTLHLGIKGKLLQTDLLQLCDDPQTSDGMQSTTGYGGQCIDSAKMIIEICDDVSRSGLLLRGHWIALQFLFSAVLMIVADCVRVARIGQMEAWNENHNYIARGVSILQSGRRGSSMVKYQVETVNKILRSLTLLYGK